MSNETELPWLRLYTEFCVDPQIQMLSFEDQRHYVMALCMKGRGMLDKAYTTPELRARIIAATLGLDQLAAAEANRRLREHGLVDELWQPIAWERRQFKSDHDAAERMRRSRQRRAEQLAAAVATGEDPHPTAPGDPKDIAAEPPAPGGDPNVTSPLRNSYGVDQNRSEQNRTQTRARGRASARATSSGPESAQSPADREASIRSRWWREVQSAFLDEIGTHPDTRRHWRQPLDKLPEGLRARIVHAAQALADTFADLEIAGSPSSGGEERRMREQATIDARALIAAYRAAHATEAA